MKKQFRALTILTAACLAVVVSSQPALATTNESSCSSSATFAVGGGYTVQANAYNIQNGGQQCTYADSNGTDWYETSTNSVPTNGEPGAYPSIYAGCHWGVCSANQQGMPMQLSSITSSPTSWSVTPSTSGNWDIAYDIWFNDSSTTSNNSTNGLELMVWINHMGTIQPAGSVVVSNVTINGITWNIWRSGSTQNRGTISYVATSGVNSVNFDLLNIYNDLVSRGYLSTNEYLIDIEAGTEIWTPGSNFQTSSFSATVSSGSGSCSAVPSAPTNLGANTVSSSQINLSWTAVTPPANCTVSGYNVYRSTSSGFTPGSGNLIASGVSGTTYDNTGLAASTTYYYVVEAVDSYGSSGPSNQASATTSASGSAPAAPTNLSASPVSSSEIDLSWTGSLNATSYDVFRSTTSGFTPGAGNEIASGVATTTYDNTGLGASSTYYYVVEAVNSYGTSGPSNQASATTLASSSNCHAGTWCLEGTLPSSANYSNTSQVTSAASSSTYVASVWIKGTGSVLLYVDAGNWGSNLTSVKCTATSSWTECTTAPFSTGSNTQITYILQDSYSGSGTVYLDDTYVGISGGANRLANPGFESGTGNWSISNTSTWAIGQY